jgi:hypothetical protein
MNYHQQEALQRIQTAKLQQATSLDLTELKLTEIPETILQLPQ